MRVTLLPVETAGYVSGLVAGLLEIGVNARAILIENHPAKYLQTTRNPAWARWTANLTHQKNNTGKVVSPILYLSGLALRLFGCVWVAAKSDQIILNNGRSLLPFQLDLLLYRILGIRVIAMMGHGSEIRPACIDSLGETEIYSAKEINLIHGECKKRRSFVRRVEAWSDLVISTPTISHYLRRSYVNGHLLGIPVSMPPEISTNSDPHSYDSAPDKLRVVHVPSAPNSKGTRVITELCLDLQSEGLIEFRVASQVTHLDAIRLLSESDLLLDQIYSDVYMPVLASEAAFLGKPSIVAGYAWHFLDSTSSRMSKPPVINILPDDLEATLRDLARNSGELQKIGLLAQKFVEGNRTPAAIAKKYVKILSDDRAYISEMKVEPGPTHYLWGCGSSRVAILSLAQVYRGKHSCF